MGSYDFVIVFKSIFLDFALYVHSVHLVVC